MRVVFALASVALLCGCPNTDTAVFVEPTIGNASVEVMSGALGDTLTGSFQLELHLGARASGTSTVNVETFSIVDASNADIVSPLEVTATPAFPVMVAQDSTVTVDLTFDSGAHPIAASEGTKLCMGSIMIRGSITDSLQDTPTGATSTPFDASCLSP